tara:strand:+ start:375 stop:518 length:144 start_codon:yes stop_codon:yes gene_type:complete
MSEKVYNLKCGYCFVSYELISENQNVPDYCPFCGEIIETEEDEDNWD